jgi:hypothetical protein
MKKEIIGELMMVALALLPVAFIALEGVLLMIRSRAWRDFVVFVTVTTWFAFAAWLIYS